jgi:hypothetical protein
VSQDAYGLAQDLLLRVAAELTTLGVAVPESQYVAPGDSAAIAFDESALMVTVDFVGVGQPASERSTVPAWPQITLFAQFSVTLLRDAAVMDDQGTPPTPEQIETDAKAQIGDQIAMQQALVTIRQDCQQPGGWVGPGAPIVIGRAQPVGPMGAAMAVVGQIQVPLW